MTIRTIVLLVAFAALSFGSLEAAAQCVTGVDTGGGGCVPPDAAGMPGYQPNDAPPPPPPVRWVDSWGAIVVDTVDVSKGVTTEQNTKEDAVRVAMDQCSQGGARHCKVVLTYYNQCAAVAWGDTYFGAAGNPTEDGAKADAIARCTRTGEQCQVVYSACSMQRRLQ
jgi:hypothetical protein